MSRSIRSYPPEIRGRARILRTQGLTHGEIRQRIGVVPQATLSHWLKDIPLDDKQQARIRAAGSLIVIHSLAKSLAA
jgi:hypothetical protein